MSVDEIVELPILQDRLRAESVMTLSRTMMRALWADNKLLAIWAVLRSCEITLSEGVCVAGVLSLSSFAATLSSAKPPLFDMDLGGKIGQAVTVLVSRMEAKSVECFVLCQMITYVFSRRFLCR